MTATDRAPVRLLSIALLITVASQLFYITVVPAAGPETVLRPAIWFGELFAFLSIALAAFTLAIRRPDQAVLWVTLAIAGILNVLQVAVGLTMFGPASEGEPQLIATVLAGAFFLSFLAKFLLAGTGIAFGLIAKGLGGLTIIAGPAAAALNLLAMIESKAWMAAAGASGTAATGLLAILLLVADNLLGATVASSRQAPDFAKILVIRA